MYDRTLRRFSPVLAALLLCATVVAPALGADPSGRVAYLSDSQGDVTYSPSGEDQWLGLQRNRPLIRGDRLWSEPDSRLEVQIGSAAVRLGPGSAMEILELDDRYAQLQLTEGSLNLRIRRLQRGETFEIATPMLAFVIDRAGRYRIDVDDYASTTTIVVWEGAGDAYGASGSFPLRAGEMATFYDSDLRDYQLSALPREDSFDRYCRERDARLDRSASLRYVGDDLAGYSQLDDYGRWRRVQSYGNVWFPSQVSDSWAPYRDGHWVWQEPWGWTWVDNAPWGFAPSHYGRWASISGRWGWIPGPRNVRPIYAPALVAFIGGSNWSLSVRLGGGDSHIGWFPLGPREVYVPSYSASREYFTRVNVNNTVINNTVINNYYGSYARGETRIGQASYANRSLENSITAVPQSVFVNAQPVRSARIELDRRAASSGEVTRNARIAPRLASVLGTATAAASPPPRGSFDRPVLARTPPPQRVAPFAQRERQLQSKPGLALEPAAPAAAQERVAERTRRVQLIDERQAATNLRGSRSRRAEDAKPAERPDPARRPARSEDRGRGGREDGEAERSADAPVAPETGRTPPRGQTNDARGVAPAPAPQSKPRPEPRATPQPENRRQAAAEREAAIRRETAIEREAATEREAASRRGAAAERNAANRRDAAAEREAAGRREAAADREAAARREAAAEREVEDERTRATRTLREREAAQERQTAQPPRSQREAQERKPAVPTPPRRATEPAVVPPLRGRTEEKPEPRDPRRGKDEDTDETDEDGDGKPDKDKPGRKATRDD